MSDLRSSILRQALQLEIKRAKELESQGKISSAGAHYVKAGAIYRRLALIAPKNKSEKMFNMAGQYETLGNTIKDRSIIKDVAGSPEIQDAVIDNLIVSQKPDITWDDIGGLTDAKQIIKEAIILPFIKSKPDFIRAPRTILLYGPPGTGKTLLAKASCNTLNATFFEARLPALLSKYFGESPKLVNALFNKARSVQPSLIFMDEFDSFAMSRAEIDESTRRVLGQILTELDGFNTKKEDQMIIMAATNKPWDLDDAAVSRFQRRIYVPLPDLVSRIDIVELHLKGAELGSDVSVKEIAQRMENFSGRDIANACQEAIITMVREQNPKLEDLGSHEIERYTLNYRSLNKSDFDNAFFKIKSSVRVEDIKKYEEWQRDFGG